MKICVIGTVGKSSLISRLTTNSFSIRHKPTKFIEITHCGALDFYEIPNTEHGKPMKCFILIATCKTQMNLIQQLQRWFGMATYTFIVRIGEHLNQEEPFLCPDDRFFHISNLSGQGIPAFKKSLIKVII